MIQEKKPTTRGAAGDKRLSDFTRHLHLEAIGIETIATLARSMSGTGQNGNQLKNQPVHHHVSVINKFDGLIFRFGDGRLDKACKQNGICISTDAVGI